MLEHISDVIRDQEKRQCKGDSPTIYVAKCSQAWSRKSCYWTTANFTKTWTQNKSYQFRWNVFLWFFFFYFSTSTYPRILVEITYRIVMEREMSKATWRNCKVVRSEWKAEVILGKSMTSGQNPRKNKGAERLLALVWYSGFKGDCQGFWQVRGKKTLDMFLFHPQREGMGALSPIC